MIMEVQPREIQLYLDHDGISPFDRWLENLRDSMSIGKSMKSVKAPTTKSYNESLTQALRDPQQAAVYLQVALEDSATEPELLQAVLNDIAIARATDRPDSPNFVSQPMHQAIPDLMVWLETIGLQLSVIPISQGGKLTGTQSLTAIETKAA